MMIYYKTESLLVCIGAHGIFNALNIFVNEAAVTDTMRIISCIFLIVVCGGYGTYVLNQKREGDEQL